MKYFAHYDKTDNLIKGFYSDEIDEVIPEPNFELNHEEFMNAINGIFETVDSETESVVKIEMMLSYEELVPIAKREREYIVNSPIGWNDAIWDIDDRSRDNMATAINTIRRNALEAMPISWILNDDSIRDTNVEELEAVLDQYALRMQNVYSQYSEWLEKGIAEPFIYYEGSID